MIEETLFEERYQYNFFYAHNKNLGGSTDKYHFHDCYEIYISLMDNGHIKINELFYDLSYGDIFIINSRDIHKVVVPQELVYERFIIMFKPEFIEVTSKELNLTDIFKYNPISFTHKRSLDEYSSLFTFEEIFADLKNIETIYYSEEMFGKEIFLKMEFTKFLLKINQIFLKTGSIANNIIPDEKIARIQDILKFIDGNLDRDLSLEELSKEFFLNKFYLCHYFKNIMGIPVKSYILKRRIELAQKLILKNTEITAVLEKTGFSNYSHFIRIFKSHTGLTPKQYKKQNQPLA